MPSASSAKIDKQQQSSSASSEVADNSTPIRQVLVIIEHKIRNLEKRKVRLESYRDIEKSGKELSSDQKSAVSKYNEVAQTLEFAREFTKQIIQIASVSEKELKKKQKKDETLKKQSEIAKIREVLVIQDVLRLLAEDGAKENFLNGTNGACKLEEGDFELLEKFSEEILPKRPMASDDQPFIHAAQKSADHLSFAIDSKPKAFGHGTYADIRNIFRNIQKCGYFDKVLLSPVVADEEEILVDEEISVNAEEKNDINSENSTEQDVVICEINKHEQPPATDVQDFQEAPAATAVPVPTFPPQQPQQQQPPLLPQQQIVSVTQPAQLVQPIPIVQPIVPVVGIANVTVPTVAIPPPTNQLHPTHMQPTTVRAVEQAYFKQHQYIQQIRPLAEVIGTGNFFFLQDSELDSPDIMPSFPPPSSTTAASTQISPTPSPKLQPPQPSQQQQSLQSLNTSGIGAAGTPQPQQVTAVTIQQHSQQPSQQPTQVLQQQQSQQQASAIAATPHTYTNQTFSSIVPTQIFTGIKPADVSQPHIPGFATPNAPIPIPLVQPAPVVQQAQQQQQQQQAPQQQHQQTLPQISQTSLVNQNQQQQSTNQIHTGPSNQSIGIASFKPGKLTTPILSNDLSTQITSQTPPKETRVSTIVPVPLTTDVNKETEQRVPEITEWKAEDATKPPHEEIIEWRDPYENADVPDWNEDTPEESNAWSNTTNTNNNNGHRYNNNNYRGHQNNYNNRNNRGPPGRSGINNNPTNGYRGGRTSNTYNPNGRQNSGGSGSSVTGGSGNTFYRNNENYYHNQNGTAGTGSGGGYRGGSGDTTKDIGYRGDGNKNDGNSGYRSTGGVSVDKQENNFRNDKQHQQQDNNSSGYQRDNKHDGGYRGGGGGGGNNFRSREPRDHNNGPMRSGPPPLPRNNNRNNSDSVDRGNQPIGGSGPRGPMHNANNRNTILTSGGAGNGNNIIGNNTGGNPRPNSKGPMYGTQARISGGGNGSRTQASVNV